MWSGRTGNGLMYPHMKMGGVGLTFIGVDENEQRGNDGKTSGENLLCD